MKRIALIACAVMQRECSYEIAITENIVQTVWLKQGLHDTPELLQKKLQEQIDIIEEAQEDLDSIKRVDAICIGYGLCSNGVIGLKSETLPIIIPRCDDCIALFLGSADRYMQMFNEKPGIYWYNPGWIEHAFTPSEESYASRFESYSEKYGEDNAEFLMEAEREWVHNYQNCIYIDSPIYHNEEYAEYTKHASETYNWAFSRVKGEQRMFHMLISGDWDNDEFLICPAGYTVQPDYDGKKIKAVCS